MIRKWIETLVLVLLFGAIYYGPILSAKLPVFYGQFNNLDGSLHAVLIFHLLVSVALVILASRHLILDRLDLTSIGRTILGLGVLLLGTSLLEWGWGGLVLRAFNLPTAPGEISDKMLNHPSRESLNLRILPGNLIILAAGIFYGLVRDRNRQIREQERLERENLEAEVKYLRSQINPHFLFNTLNNIYAITQRNEDREGSDALLRLSGLMRYMLYDTESSSVDLNREIEHLESYMELMLLKYKQDDPPETGLRIEGDPQRCQVAPLILLPFVENAFKHGIDSKGRGKIDIHILAEPSHLNFRVENTRFPERQASQEHKGIGLENVKRRLAHLYPQRHKLTIDEQNDIYRIDLRIEL